MVLIATSIGFISALKPSPCALYVWPADLGASFMTWLLLTAGVRIYEYRPGLLHAKTLCLDGVLSLIGSTNLDLRSFDLNFDNNVLLQDEATTPAITKRQHDYQRDSHAVTLEQVHAMRKWKRIWDNLLGR